jgi:hypothetical protein
MAFLGFKFQRFPPRPPIHAWYVGHTWPSAIAILLWYIISQRGPFSKNAPPPGRILKKGPGVGRITITGVFTTLQINNRLPEFWFLLNFDLSLNSLKHAISERISRAVTWGGGGIFHIFMFTYRKINRFQMKSVGQNTNVWMTHPIIVSRNGHESFPKALTGIFFMRIYTAICYSIHGQNYCWHLTDLSYVITSIN